MKNGRQRLGENLKRLRAERGISQVELADMIKVDKSYISNIENAKCNPTLSTIERLSNILNTQVSDLLS